MSATPDIEIMALTVLASMPTRNAEDIRRQYSSLSH